jgi:Proliferating cell nuclear antigen, N-terminal domain
MFEARIVQGSQLKKIIEAIRELVVDANLDCNEAGITMQVSYPKSSDNGCSTEAAKVLQGQVATAHATTALQ